jgi:prolyl-tRNA synthetase
LQLKGDQLVPDGELSEAYIVRPTSETIIGDAFSRWIKSYHDLPLLTNQWANVVRWEMRPRLFLRTAEFLWQEGHTAHQTVEEALRETTRMLEVYKDLAQDVLKIPVLTGHKSDLEKFAGAVNTYAIEGIMQDGKALQMGTSHYLGQNFSRSFDIKFADADGSVKFVHTTSWGVSTRLIGGLIMAHGDDNGLVLPSGVAPAQLVIIPILKDDPTVIDFARELQLGLQKIYYQGSALRVKLDDRANLNGGEKNWDWIKKGVPLRLEVGGRDIAQDRFPLSLRCKDRKDRQFLSRQELLNLIPEKLQENDRLIFDRAVKYRNDFMHDIDNQEEFYRFFNEEVGVAKSFWKGNDSLEKSINDLGITIRLLNSVEEEGYCPFTGAKSKTIAYFAKAY